MKRPRCIGLLFERQIDPLLNPEEHSQTLHYWREPEEVDAIAAHLLSLGYEVDLIGSINELLQRWHSQQFPDLVWNLADQSGNGDRTALAPAILDQFQLPYTGGNAAVKSFILNQDWLKPTLQSYGILIPRWCRYSRGDEIVTLPPWSNSLLQPTLTRPFLKPRIFHASEGLSAFRAAIRELQERTQTAIWCEEIIPGTEIQGGMVGHKKPLWMGAFNPLTQTPLASNSPEFIIIQSTVLEILKLFNPLDYATFQFKIAPDGKVYLIQIDADPTLHPEQTLAQIALATGLSYEQLLETILQTALERWNHY